MRANGKNRSRCCSFRYDVQWASKPIKCLNDTEVNEFLDSLLSFVHHINIVSSLITWLTFLLLREECNMHRGHRDQDLASMAFVQNKSFLPEWVYPPCDATRSTISSAELPDPESASSNHANQSEEAAVRSGFTDDSASPPSLLYRYDFNK